MKILNNKKHFFENILINIQRENIKKTMMRRKTSVSAKWNDGKPLMMLKKALIKPRCLEEFLGQ